MNPVDPHSAILVVDDRHENLVALSAVLDPLGAPVVTAQSGDEALRALLSRDFALILLDVQMPGMDGFSTAQLIKSHPRTAQTPIIFLTAFDERLDHAVDGYTSGAVDYLSKPFDPWVLRSKVQVFLDLHRKNMLLARQAEELEAHVEQLRASRSALAEAQRIARLGSFELDVRTGAIEASEQFRRIFRLDAAAVVDAIELLDRLRDDDAPGTFEAEIVGPDDRVRRVSVNAERERDVAGRLVRVVGTVQDVTEQRAAAEALARASADLEREREVVQLLQRSMLPAGLPAIPELDIAEQYLPSGEGLAGGDWWDVLAVPNGVMLVIGDVAGHGIAAASTMSQIRTALRVIAMREHAPAAVLREINRFLVSAASTAFATMVIAHLDLDTGACRFSSAGHLPPVLCAEAGASPQWSDIGPPLGADPLARFTESEIDVLPGDTLVLYTDGLVERRGEILDDGLERLTSCAGDPAEDSAALVERLISRLCGRGPADDVAVLAVRRRPPTPFLQLSVDAEPDRLAALRLSVRRWLASLDIEPAQVEDLVLAASELSTNVCLHAYPRLAPGKLFIDGLLDEGELRISVRDEGRWGHQRATGGGRGLALLRALGLDLQVDKGDDGTTVTIATPLRPRSTETREGTRLGS